MLEKKRRRNYRYSREGTKRTHYPCANLIFFLLVKYSNRPKSLMWLSSLLSHSTLFFSQHLYTYEMIGTSRSFINTYILYYMVLVQDNINAFRNFFSHGLCTKFHYHLFVLAKSHINPRILFFSPHPPNPFLR